MIPADHRIYSCDDHLDIFNVPRDLWASRLPAKYRGLGPRVEERGEHHLWMVGDHVIGPSGNFAGYLTALSRVEVEDDGSHALRVVSGVAAASPRRPTAG